MVYDPNQVTEAQIRGHHSRAVKLCIISVILFTLEIWLMLLGCKTYHRSDCGRRRILCTIYIKNGL